MQATANVNGSLSAAEAAVVPISDRGFLYGDSIYEVVRTYEGVPFFHEEHLDRLENSARLAKMRISQSRDFLKKEIERTVAAASPKKGQDVFVRYTITRGSSPLDLDPAVAPETRYVILVKELPAWNPRFMSEGVKLAVPFVRRNPPLALDPNIKSGNYLNNVLAVAEAKERGGDDALFLSIDGRFTECSNSNICFILNGELHTPKHEPRSLSGNLRGLTRVGVEQGCRELGIAYHERDIRPLDIAGAEECFVTSATREVMPVKSLLLEDGTKLEFPSGGGVLTKRLRETYLKGVAAYVRKHKEEAWF